MCCFQELFCIIEGGRGDDIFTLCLFGIQCSCVHGLVVFFICCMFYVLCSRVCVGHGLGTIAEMLFICYPQGSIFLAVCVAYF